MTEFRTTTHHAPLPALRAGVFATVGTVLGVSAHHLVAGGPAPWWQGAVATALLFGVGLVGTRRPRSLATVVATCGAAQAGLHVWLMAGHRDDPSGGAMTMAPAHPGHGAVVHEAWHGRTYASTAMTVAHAVVAVLVALLLHRADAVCWSLARGLTAAVDAVQTRIALARVLWEDRPAPAGPRLGGPALVWRERKPPQAAVLTDVVVRRGPPRAGFALAN
ncbi:hypothetical protein [Streptomyces sp. NPDC096132]|uniref:hypothetical protein n=1 Tax=Streptomyces sp. NPDC096132 TaxID=3366075 RepID=UPI00380AEACE